MRMSTIVALASVSLASPCIAQDCADQTQFGLDQCANASYQKADAALNGVYKQIVRRLKDDAATTKLLVQAQKAWIGYRDAECTFATSASAGGSIYPMEFSICLEAQTKKRTDDLRVYLKCEEGGLGCPVPAE
jgi:uncharacterized protein YecT (DUF1311 family)